MLVDRLLFPGAYLPSGPCSVGDGEALHRATTELDETLTVVARAPAPPLPWLAFFGGNAMTLADTADIRAELAARGIGFLGVDYPGYGESTGRPSEYGCYRAADAALDLLRDEHRVESDAVVAAGWSLGAAVAANLASRRRVRGLVLLSPLLSARSVAFDRLRLGGSRLGRGGPFDVRGLALRIRCPALIVTGAADTLTRPWHARALADAVGGDVTLAVLPGREHNDLLDAGSDLWDPVRDFVTKLAAP